MKADFAQKLPFGGRMMSFHDGLVLSQFAPEPHVEEDVVPRKILEERKARNDKYYKAVSLAIFFVLWQVVCTLIASYSSGSLMSSGAVSSSFLYSQQPT